MRKTCLDMVYELARQDPRIFFIGSDLGIGTLDRFKAEMPERFLMEGVSEANLIGMATGLALDGKIAYLNTIATFITRRCFEQIVVDLALHNVPVRLIGSGGGLVYAPLGPTHEAIDDLAILRAVPNMTILAPADAAEMRRLMPATVDHPGPIYIRLAKGGDPLVTDPERPFAIGPIVPMRDGDDALVVSTGVMLQPALQAAEALTAAGIATGVVHVPTIKPLDAAGLLARIGRVPTIVTVEEHTIIGGLGSAVAELIAEADFDQPRRFRRLGLPDAFPDEYGSQNSLWRRYGLTTEQIVATVTSLAR